MRKLLFIVLLAFFLFSCDDDGVKDQETENPKIYNVTYDGNGNTEGKIPADDNLYAAGDKLPPKWDYFINKGTDRIIAWELKGAASVEKPYKNFADGTCWVDRKSVITVGESDIELKAIYLDQLPSDRFTVTYHSEGHTSGDVPVDLNTYTADDDVRILPPNHLATAIFFADFSITEEVGITKEERETYGLFTFNTGIIPPLDHPIVKKVRELWKERGIIYGTINIGTDSDVSAQLSFQWRIDDSYIQHTGGIIKITKNTDVYAVYKLNN